MEGLHIPKGLEVVIGYADGTLRTYHNGDKVIAEPSMRLIGMKWMPGCEPGRKQVSAPIAPPVIYAQAMIYTGMGLGLYHWLGASALIVGGILLVWLIRLWERALQAAVTPPRTVPD
jgi:hypothetical protein